jgi:molybdopterin biosynthesis enzyme
MGATNYSNEQVNAILMKDWIKKGERKEFVLGNYLLSDGIYRVIPNEKQGSHFIGSLAKSNCLIVTDYGPKTYKKDEMVKIITL